MTKKIFTKTFFQLDRHDQAAVVESYLNELAVAYANSRSSGRESLHRTMLRVRRKAVEYGLYDEPQPFKWEDEK